MTRVLHIASGDLWGGAEAQLDTLARTTSKLGAAVSAVLLNTESELGRRLRAAGIPVLQFDEQRMSAPTITARLVKYVRQFKPDIIHTHRFKENIIGSVVAAIARVPSIRTVHGAEEPELKNLTARRRMLRAADTITAKFMQQRVVAVSGELAKRLDETQRLRNLCVIQNGVDVEALSLAGRDQASEVPKRLPPRLRIGYFGRLVPVKRLDLLLRAAAILRDTFPEKFAVYLIGEGPELSSLKQLAADLQVDSLVEFIGFRRDAPAWLSVMDCTVLTSDHEGLPMIALESLALGVPLVARAVGGLPEVLRDIGACRLVESATPDSIASALASVLLHGQSSCKRTSLLPERYSANAMATAYMNLYDEVLRGKSDKARSKR